jgi:hypothetical protein
MLSLYSRKQRRHLIPLIKVGIGSLKKPVFTWRLSATPLVSTRAPLCVLMQHANGMRPPCVLHPKSVRDFFPPSLCVYHLVNELFCSDPAAAGSRKQTIGALITKQTAGFLVRWLLCISILLFPVCAHQNGLNSLHCDIILQISHRSTRGIRP